MSLSQLGSAPTFQNHVQGMIGEFETPAGKVSYLMTKSRLGADATDPERRLTQHLVPVREVIPSEELDFNQLLQRDLDDHRVAVSLVPYLLNPGGTGPAFFPPIIAIVLPFLGQHPSDFPELGTGTTVEENSNFWNQRDAGLHMRTRRLLTADGNISPIPLGELWWNGEFCRIVVVDGQHRAMALLAIDRTVRSTWQETGAGVRYRYFYETRIKKSVGEHKPQLDKIEVPVTILWFPEKFGPGLEPHKAARKLFVDVNKEARTPSESRLILLSDSELVNILTRTTLTQLRNQAVGEFLPLYSIEYDNPDTKTTQSARWSAMTNIHVLKHMVTRTVFGPPRYVNQIAMPIGRREPEEEKNSFMRKQLKVESLFPPTLAGDQPFPRDRLGNKDFPEEAVAPLAKQYQDTWSTALLVLLSEVLPYAAHARALSQLKQDWLADDAIATLAHDALFSGVGMFWTLRDSASFWEDEKVLLGSGKNRPDIVKAWDLIEAKQADFEDRRATELLGSTGKREIANQLYQSVNTHACQLGLALTLVTLHQRALAPSSDVVTLARGMAAGVNAWMLSKSSGDYDRRLALSKRKDGWPKNALNVISNMDMPRAIQFRYFWLEILCSAHGMEELSSLVNDAKVNDLRDEARRAYIAYVAGEKEKALKTSEPNLTEAQRKARAKKEASKEIRQALLKWFDLSAQAVDTWLASADNVAAVDAAVEAASKAEDEPQDEAGEPDGQGELAD